MNSCVLLFCFFPGGVLEFFSSSCPSLFNECPRLFLGFSQSVLRCLLVLLVCLYSCFPSLLDSKLQHVVLVLRKLKDAPKRIQHKLGLA